MLYSNQKGGHVTLLSNPTFTHKQVFGEEDWDYMVRRLTGEYENCDPALAERIMELAVGHLLAVDMPDGAPPPNPIVSVGWRNIALVTRLYQRFCLQVVGFMVYYQPDFDQYANNNAGLVERPRKPRKGGDCYGDQCRGSGDGG